MLQRRNLSIRLAAGSKAPIEEFLLDRAFSVLPNSAASTMQPRVVNLVELKGWLEIEAANAERCLLFDWNVPASGKSPEAANRPAYTKKRLLHAVT